ncbi:cd36 [Blomia tropicalis]|nr:cd36 [Blomia tropicalis]
MISKKTALKLSISLFLILSSFILYNVFYPLTIQYVIENKALILKPDSRFYETWFVDYIRIFFLIKKSKMNEPTKCEIYLFDLTNPRQFLLGQRPQLKQRGPFVFNHYKNKLNFTWLDNGRRLSYQESSIYHFDREQSVAGLDDFNITVVNLALVATMNTLWKHTSSGLLNILSPAVTSFTKQLMSSSSEYIMERRTPGQLLIGRRAYFIDRIQQHLNLAKSFGLSFAESPLSDMKNVGYFRFTNNTVSPPIIIYTGVRSFSEMVEEYVHHNRDNSWLRLFADMFGYGTFGSNETLDDTQLASLDLQLDRQFMKMYEFEGKRYYGKVLKANCNDIKGTDGTANNNYLVQEKKNLFLHTAICRPLSLTFDGYKELNQFHSVNRYVLNDKTFESNKQNWCFCPGVTAVRQRSQDDRRVCTRRRNRSRITCRWVPTKNSTSIYKVVGNLNKCNGYHDMSICNDFLPIGVSFPHFMYSPHLRKAIDGLEPNMDQHSSRFTIEPNFGITMNAHVRIQVNVRVHPAASDERYNKFKPTLMPYLWMSESGQMGRDVQRKLTMTLWAFDGGYFACWIFAIIGFIIIFLMMCNCRKVKVKDDQFLILDNSKNPKIKSNKNTSIPITRKKIAAKIMKHRNWIVKKSSSGSSLNQIIPNESTENSSSTSDTKEVVSLNSVHVHTNSINKTDSTQKEFLPPLG